MGNLKKLTMMLAAAVVISLLPVAGAQAMGSATGQGDVTIKFQNLEGQPHPQSPPIDSGVPPVFSIPPILPLTTRMVLSDANNAGTFAMEFNIYERQQTVFDSFRVTNTGNTPFVFTLMSEDEIVEPAGSNPNFSDLLVCFNALCDLGVYAPDSLFVKPAPFGVVLPGQSQIFKIGIKLAAGADWNKWDGVGVFSTLHFRAVPAL